MEDRLHEGFRVSFDTHLRDPAGNRRDPQRPRRAFAPAPSASASRTRSTAPSWRTRLQVEFGGFRKVAKLAKPPIQSSPSVMKPISCHQSHGGRGSHGQPHVKAVAAMGGCRKARLYMGLTMRTSPPARLGLGKRHPAHRCIPWRNPLRFHLQRRRVVFQNQRRQKPFSASIPEMSRATDGADFRSSMSLTWFAKIFPAGHAGRQASLKPFPPWLIFPRIDATVSARPAAEFLAGSLPAASVRPGLILEFSEYLHSLAIGSLIGGDPKKS